MGTAFERGSLALVQERMRSREPTAMIPETVCTVETRALERGGMLTLRIAGEVLLYTLGGAGESLVGIRSTTSEATHGWSLGTMVVTADLRGNPWTVAETTNTPEEVSLDGETETKGINESSEGRMIIFVETTSTMDDGTPDERVVTKGVAIHTARRLVSVLEASENGVALKTAQKESVAGMLTIPNVMVGVACALPSRTVITKVEDGMTRHGAALMGLDPLTEGALIEGAHHPPFGVGPRHLRGTWKIDLQ